MFAILLSAAVTCVCSLFIGQGVLRLCGASGWNWLAPPLGLSIAMVVAVPAIHIPGRSLTMAVVVGAMTVAAAIWCLRSPAHRPPVGGLLAALPVVFLALLPFLAAGRAGILGTTVDNDMAAHMLIAQAYVSESVAKITPILPEYPIGPHAMVALIAKGLSVRVDHAFTGWTMAIPILNAWTAIAVLHRRAAWLKQATVATVVSMPFLVAAYYGQGSFKELAQAGFVLATALYFCGCGLELERGRWVPLAILCAGIISVYSVTGLPWPAAFFALWLLGLLAQRIYRHGARELSGWVGNSIGRELPGLGIALACFVVVLIPQIRRIHDFISINFGGNGIVVPKDVLANLVAPLPGWEAFGVWNNADYRLPSSPAFTGGMWTAFVFGLVLFGAYWCLRRGRWMLPLAAAASMLIWADSIRTQSPYTVAKALVIVSPLLLMLAVLPLIEQLPDRWPRSVASLVRKIPGQPFAWGLAAVLVVLLAFQVGVSDVRALRGSPIGPADHADELRSLRPLVHGRPTLFLGDDDFIRWELAGVPVGAPVLGFVTGVPPIREEKKWEAGEPLDFDTVGAASLDSYDYVITTNDRAGSQPPPQMHLVKETPNFQLWHRAGEVKERSILPEGESSGAVLDCSSPEGRKIARAGGVAAVRPAPVAVPGTSLDPAGVATIELPLVPGEWMLESSYLSRLPISVTGHRLDSTLDPNLDRAGPRFPIGKVVVHRKETVDLTLTVGNTLFAPNQIVAELGKVTATRKAPERVVPIHQACGRYVDWYRSGSHRTPTAPARLARWHARL